MRLNQSSSYLHVLPFPQPLHPLHPPQWYYNSDYIIQYNYGCMHVAIKYVAHELYETIVAIASYLGSDFMFASNFMLCIQQSRDMQQSDNLIIDKLLKLTPSVTHMYTLTLSSKDSNSFPIHWAANETTVSVTIVCYLSHYSEGVCFFTYISECNKINLQWIYSATNCFACLG